MKDTLENTIKGLRKIQEEEYNRLGDMADQSAENAVAWLEYLDSNKCPEIAEEDRSSVLKRCEATWNACYPDRKPWSEIGAGAQQEWLRVFGAFEQSGRK